jgi:hypothetical protein
MREERDADGEIHHEADQQRFHVESAAGGWFRDLTIEAHG